MRIFSHKMLPWVLGVMVAMSLTPTQQASAATLTNTRTCADFVTGDGYRRLSICARGYVDGLNLRGVVEMHTYARFPGYNGWYDSRSQSISLNAAEPVAPASGFGTQIGPCRINGAGGAIGCSVPNVTRVAFYGPQGPRRSDRTTTLTVRYVSWRDDRGLPHYVFKGSGSSPGTLPISYSWA